MPVEQIKHIVDYGIIGLLLFLSFLIIAFAIERVLYFRSIKLARSIKTSLHYSFHRFKRSIYRTAWDCTCYHLDILYHRRSAR